MKKIIVASLLGLTLVICAYKSTSTPPSWIEGKTFYHYGDAGNDYATFFLDVQKQKYKVIYNGSDGMPNVKEGHYILNDTKTSIKLDNENYSLKNCGDGGCFLMKNSTTGHITQYTKFSFN